MADFSTGTLPAAGYRSDIAYGAGKFVTVSTSNDSVCYSSDGVNWLTATIPGATGSWLSVIFAAGQFVALANGFAKFATSPDGITWTLRSGGDVFGQGLAYGAGLYVAITTNHTVHTSPDGIIWTSRTIPTNNWGNIAFGNGTFVIGNLFSALTLTSTDGITWVSHSVASSASNLSFNGGAFFLFNGSVFYTSTDGAAWTSWSGTAAPAGWSGASGALVVCGSAVFLAGAAWTQLVLPGTASWTAAASSGVTAAVVVSTTTAFAYHLPPTPVFWTRFQRCFETDS